MAFDGYAWLLSDPVTWVGVAPVAEVSWPSELPRHIRLKYATPLNRWTNLGTNHVACLHAVTGGDLAQSLLWRELLYEHGVGDVASLVFPDQHGCWAFLELFRDAARGPFTSDEVDFLAGVVTPLTGALRRSQARSFPAAAHQSRAHAGPVVLLLSPQLEVMTQTPEAHDYLQALVPRDDGQPPVPAGAYNVAAQLLAIEAGVDDHPAQARVHVSDSLWVTLRAARLAGAGEPALQPIAVTIEECPPLDRLDLFARAFGLTARETELLVCMAGGADTKALASQLFVSQHTVQDHLKSMFAKTATRSRPALLSCALGT